MRFRHKARARKIQQAAEANSNQVQRVYYQ